MRNRAFLAMLAAGSLAGFGLALGGCDSEKEPAEQVEEAADDAADAVEDAAEEVQEGAEEVGEELAPSGN